MMVACDEGPESGDSTIPLEATLDTNVTTVITVRWTTDDPSRGKVVYGVLGEATRETPLEAEATTAHEVVVLGMPVESEVELQGIGDDGVETERAGITTGSPPADWPSFEVTTDEATFEGYVFSSIGGAHSGLFALDSHGRTVWWWEAAENTSVEIRVFPSLDRTGVYSDFGGMGATVTGTLAKFSWTGEQTASMDIPDLSHDFLEKSDGSFAAIAFTEHERDGGPCNAEAIIEFEWGVEPVQLWDAWDTYQDVDSPCLLGDAGFTHMNALDWEEDAQQYVIGSRNLSTLTVVDAATAQTVESIGAFGGIQAVAEDVGFLYQHQFERTSADRYLVFDDGGPERSYSRVQEVEIDRTMNTFRTVWSYENDPPIYVYLLGDVERLPNQNTLIDWSTAGRLQEVTPAGEVLFQVDVELGHGFGYMKRVDSLYVE